MVSLCHPMRISYKANEWSLLEKRLSVKSFESPRISCLLHKFLVEIKKVSHQSICNLSAIIKDIVISWYKWHWLKEFWLKKTYEIVGVINPYMLWFKLTTCNYRRVTTERKAELQSINKQKCESHHIYLSFELSTNYGRNKVANKNIIEETTPDFSKWCLHNKINISSPFGLSYSLHYIRYERIFVTSLYHGI